MAYYNTQNLITFSQAIKQLQLTDLNTQSNSLILKITTPTQDYFYSLPYHQQTHLEGHTDSQIKKLNKIFKTLHPNITTQYSFQHTYYFSII